MTGRRRRREDDEPEQRGPHGTWHMPGGRTTRGPHDLTVSLFQVKGSPKLVLVAWSQNGTRLFLLDRSYTERLIVDEVKVHHVTPTGDQRTLDTDYGYMNIPAPGVRGGGMLDHVQLVQLVAENFTITYDRRGRPTSIAPKG